MTNAPDPHGDETTTAPHGEETAGGPASPVGQDPLLGDAGLSDAPEDSAAGPAAVPGEAGGRDREDIEAGNPEAGDLEEDGYEDDEEEDDEDDEDDEVFAPAPFDLFGGGAGGMGGLGGLFSQLGKVRETVANAQQAADTEIEGSAGGGAVRIVGTAGLDFRAVVVDPAVVQSDDVEMLQDLLLAAMRDFAERARGVQQQAMGDFGGMDFGSLFGG
jgi:DNA-binding protein YbaB